MVWLLPERYIVDDRGEHYTHDDPNRLENRVGPRFWYYHVHHQCTVGTVRKNDKIVEQNKDPRIIVSITRPSSGG